jgi:hypothetical protein
VLVRFQAPTVASAIFSYLGALLRRVGGIFSQLTLSPQVRA